MAANLGFRVDLAHDACAAFTGNANTGWSDGLTAPDAHAIHTAALSHLHGEFANVRASAAILAEAP